MSQRHGTLFWKRSEGLECICFEKRSMLCCSRSETSPSKEPKADLKRKTAPRPGSAKSLEAPLALCAPPTRRPGVTSRLTPVRLNIYHLIDTEKNAKFAKLGFGLYHSGVEIFGIEWSYGDAYEVGQSTGLFYCIPGTACATLYKTIELGYTELSAMQVDTILHRVENEWPCKEYHLLHHNCNHFTAHFCKLLTTGDKLEVPSWVNRSARWSDRVVPRRLAVWVAKKFDDTPLANAPPQPAGQRWKPRSIIPERWYDHPFVRQDMKYTQRHSVAAVPRAGIDAYVNAINDYIVDSAAHESNVGREPPPRRADQTSPRDSMHQERYSDRGSVSSPVVHPPNDAAVELNDIDVAAQPPRVASRLRRPHLSFGAVTCVEATNEDVTVIPETEGHRVAQFTHTGTLFPTHSHSRRSRDNSLAESDSSVASRTDDPSVYTEAAPPQPGTRTFRGTGSNTARAQAHDMHHAAPPRPGSTPPRPGSTLNRTAEPYVHTSRLDCAPPRPVQGTRTNL